eukprot:jgi/Galph1/4400/GphlegSOOS_G3086.1
MPNHNGSDQPKKKKPNKKVIQKGPSHKNFQGFDVQGKLYDNVEQVWLDWVTARSKNSKQNSWYSVAQGYWQKQNPSLDSMLGGYSNLSTLDIDTSAQFLEKLILPSKELALDVGSGIGRVASKLLMTRFKQVDLLEPNEEFVAYAKKTLDASRLGWTFCCAMQDFVPQVGRRYDLIWIQWCIIYLTDDDLVSFLERCCGALKHEGAICIKDNCSKEHFVVDTNDASITRTDEHYRILFNRAGLEVIRQQLQMRFPKELFSVYMYALKPKSKV